MSEPLSEANGFAHAYSTWIAQGNGLDTRRDGVFRYKAGPMKGMTRDQAQMHFQNKVWKNATPEWKNEFAKRATSDLLAPSEKSDLERRKAFASPITQPQYKPEASLMPIAQEPPVITKPTKSAATGGIDLPDNYILPGDDSKILAGPPSPEQSKIITQARYRREGKAPAKAADGKFDLMKADYSTLTTLQRHQRTQANIARNKALAESVGIAEPMPAMTVTAPRMKPLETKYDMAQGRVVQTGGDATEEFTNYDKAQKAAQSGTATAQQRQNIADFVSQDVLGRQPEQVAKLREDERKGYYQAGRYVGPAQPAAPRMPVSAPVFASGGKRSNPAPVATRQPSFGNRAGTGATRMPI